MRPHPGIFKRGDIWWYQVGRNIRRSSGSKIMSEAMALRAQTVSVARHRQTQDAWSAHVSDQRADSNSWLRRAYNHMRRRTGIRGWEPCISLEEFHQIVLMSDGKCAVSSLPFSRDAIDGHRPFAISVDRIRSDEGYVPGNVRVVLLAVNLAMSHWGEAAFRQIARGLVGRELVESAHTALHTAFSADPADERGST